jgi:hypothetical protein
MTGRNFQVLQTLVLAEHYSGCLHTQKSSVAFHLTDYGQYIVCFIFQMIFRFHLASKCSTLISFLKTIYIDFYLGSYINFFLKIIHLKNKIHVS